MSTANSGGTVMTPAESPTTPRVTRARTRAEKRLENQAANEMIGWLKRNAKDRGYGSDTDWTDVKAKSRARAAAKELERS